MACKAGFIIDKSGLFCIPAVLYCSIYKNGKCSQCIEGFILNNNECVRLSSDCSKTDSKGVCIQCQEGFSIAGGVCLKDSPIPTCTSSQYLSAKNVCVTGNIPKCVNYISPSG